MNQPAFYIFIDTVCEGWVPAWHDEQGMPVVYPTVEAAQREIADDVMEKLRQFLDGQRDFDGGRLHFTRGRFTRRFNSG